MSYGLTQRSRGRVRMQAVDAAGKVRKDTGWLPNLILNQGLDGLAVRFWADSFTSAALGDSDLSPTKVSGGATTYAQSNVTVTLSGGSFVLTNTATDQGKVFKLSGGQESTIVAVLSPTQATVNTSATISPTTFYLYQTTQTGLGHELKRSSVYYTPASGCTTLLAAPNTIIMRRAFDFPVESPVLVTYKEVGMSWSSAPGSNLFSRVIFPLPIDVAPGLRPRVFYELTLVVAPSAPAVRTANVSGWPVAPASTTNGFESMEDWGLAVVSSSGVTVPYRTVSGVDILACEPAAFADVLVGDDVQGLSSPGDPVKNRWTAGAFEGVLANEIYVPGSFNLTRTAELPTNGAVSTALRVFAMGHIITSAADFLPVVTLRFDEAQTKTGSYLLGLAFRLSWGRVLT